MGGLNVNAAAAPEYLTADATVGDVTQDVAATGTIAPAETYGVVFGADPYLVTDTATAPNVTATYPVTEVKVKVGDSVKQGDVLATASTTDLERQLEAAQNTLDSAKVSLRAANATRDDADASGNTAQIRQAKIGQYNAENQVATAQGAVADLKAQIKAATIKAPIDGLVTAVAIRAGFDAPRRAGRDHRQQHVPDHDRRRRERSRRHRGRPGCRRLDRGHRRERHRHRVGHLARRVGHRVGRVVSGHRDPRRGTRQGTLRDDRRRDDHRSPARRTS